MEDRIKEPATKNMEEEVISINRVTKVTKGGRQLRFAATVVVGDKNGQVGIGTGKANEVPNAIKKASLNANKNLVKISLIDGRTIPHEIIGKSGAAKVLIKPASEGTGIIAGGPIRTVLELVGIRDILSKSLGSRTAINMARATLDGLKSLKTIDDYARLRGKDKEEIV